MLTGFSWIMAFAAGQATPVISKGPASIPSAKMTEELRGRLTAHRFAECLLVRKPRSVERILASSGVERRATMQKIDLSDCLSEGSLRFQANLLTGALYGAKYRVLYGGSTAPELAADNDDATFFGPDVIADSMYGRFLISTACAVRAKPALAREIILAAPATRESTEAFAAFVPALGACTPQATSFHVSKTVLEGAIAEVLFRRAVRANGRSETSH